VRVTREELKVRAGNRSASKKSGLLRWVSRCGSGIDGIHIDGRLDAGFREVRGVEGQLACDSGELAADV